MFLFKGGKSEQVYIDISGDNIKIDHIKRGRQHHYVEPFYTVKEVPSLVGIRTLDKVTTENLKPKIKDILKSYKISKDASIHLVYNHIDDQTKEHIQAIFSSLKLNLKTLLSVENAMGYYLVSQNKLTAEQPIVLLYTNLYNFSVSKIELYNYEPKVAQVYYEGGYSKMSQIGDFQAMLRSLYFENQFQYDSSTLSKTIDKDSYKRQIEKEARLDTLDYYKAEKLYQELLRGKIEYENKVITSQNFSQKNSMKINTSSLSLHRLLNKVYGIDKPNIPLVVAGYKTITTNIKDLRINGQELQTITEDNEDCLLAGLKFAQEKR